MSNVWLKLNIKITKDWEEMAFAFILLQKRRQFAFILLQDNLRIALTSLQRIGEIILLFESPTVKVFFQFCSEILNCMRKQVENRV